MERKESLLVEGRDDLHAIVSSMTQHGVDFKHRPPGVPEIKECDNDAGVLEAIPMSAKTYDRLGIMLDADFPPTNRWVSVRDRLRSPPLSLVVPDNLPSDGLVIDGWRPNSLIGVWLMPDNIEPGMLEDFLGNLVPPNDLCWPYTDEVVDTAKANGAAFGLTHKSKARIHSWLAWQEPPGRPFGTAITAQLFLNNSPLALRFAHWFARVFPESGANPPPA